MTWPNLTVRLKQRVVDLLDYESRCALRLSSRDDRDVVDSTKFKPSTLKIQEFPSEMSEGKTIIRCDMDTLTIWLSGKENLTRIDRGWNGEIMENASEVKQENRYEILNRFLSWITHKGVLRVETVELEGIDFPPSGNFQLKCHNLTLYHIGNNHHLEWIRNSSSISRKYKKLSIRCWGDERELRTIHSVLYTFESLRLDYESDFNDEQLYVIQATDLKIMSNRFTVDGARRRLEYFLTNAKKTDILEITFGIAADFNYDQVFPKSLRRKKLEREHDQEGDYHGKIFSGFQNIHGIQDPWEVDCMNFGESIRLLCRIYEKSTRPCMLYPFYHLRG